MKNEKLIAPVMEEAFKEWRIRQLRQGNKVISIDKFADYLDVSQSMVSYWLTEERFPSGKNLIKILPKLEELIGSGVYDKLGLARQDRRVSQLIASYDVVPQEEKDKFLAEVRKLLLENGWVRES